MFTGIVEALGKVLQIDKDQENLIFSIESAISQELKPDQSVAHNGVCLTVTAIKGQVHEVTAIGETLALTNLSDLKTGDVVNLERCMRIGDRLDGHMVQGHVDTCGVVQEVKQEGGSWLLKVEYDKNAGFTVKKGSICLNGVSLTVVYSQAGLLSVAIIPYTWQHTNFHLLQPGNKLNIEFDIFGKYLQELYLRNQL